MSLRIKILVPLLALCAVLAVPSLASAASFKWATHARIEPAKDGGLNAVSCASTSFCLAGDQSGQILTTTTPVAASPKWSAAVKVDNDGSGITGVSCPTSTFCAAVDGVGAFVYSTTPTAGAKHWSHPVRIDSTAGTGGGYAGLASISCPSSSLCVAVDNATKGNVIYSTDPTGGKAAWHTLALQGPVSSVTCPSTKLCVATGSETYATTAPGTATAWKATSTVSGAILDSVSCIGSTLCVGVGYGNTSPGISSSTSSATGTWAAPVAVESNPPAPGQGLIDTVGCTQGICVAVDQFDNAFISTKPATGIWGGGAAIRGKSVASSTAISCTAGMCVVVDSAGVETTGKLS